MVRVKICGITNAEDAVCGVEAGADALGFIFYPKSPRYVKPETVSRIVSALPPFVTPVGVFVNLLPDEVTAIARAAGLRWVQLQGDETPEVCAAVGAHVIRAVRVGHAFDVATLRPYAAHGVGTFLLDTAKKGFYGGTGETFDWAAAVATKSVGRVVLSGGLDPDNVRQGIEQVNPYAVDASSGVEVEPGKKDHEKVRAFIEAARSRRAE